MPKPTLKPARRTLAVVEREISAGHKEMNRTMKPIFTRLMKLAAERNRLMKAEA